MYHKAIVGEIKFRLVNLHKRYEAQDFMHKIETSNEPLQVC